MLQKAAYPGKNGAFSDNHDMYIKAPAAITNAGFGLSPVAARIPNKQLHISTGQAMWQFSTTSQSMWRERRFREGWYCLYMHHSNVHLRNQQWTAKNRAVLFDTQYWCHRWTLQNSSMKRYCRLNLEISVSQHKEANTIGH